MCMAFRMKSAKGEASGRSSLCDMISQYGVESLVQAIAGPVTGRQLEAGTSDCYF